MASVTSKYEQRDNSRRPVLHAGVCAYDKGAVKFGCSIRNISEKGAYITFAVGHELPNEVWLIDIPAKCAYRATVKWKRGTGFGLSVWECHQISEIRKPELSFLRRIWLAQP